MDRARLADAVEQAQSSASEHGGVGAAVVQLTPKRGDAVRLWFAATPTCEHCHYRAEENPHPRWFSFNHHSGACTSCVGLGRVVVCPEDLLVNHPDRPTFDGAISHRGGHFTFLTGTGGYYHEVAAVVAERFGFDLDLPWIAHASLTP